jgi:hypothetical protein
MQGHLYRALSEQTCAGFAMITIATKENGQNDHFLQK